MAGLEMTEAQLQRLVENAAELGGWMVFHDNDSRRNNPGFPDLVLLRPPDLLFIELKSVRGRVTAEQALWIEQLGQVDYMSTDVVRPADADALISRLLARPERVGRRGHDPSDHLFDNVDPAECPECDV